MDIIAMQLDDTLLTVFTAKIDERNGRKVIQIPERELELGSLSTGDTYQVALLDSPVTAEETASTAPPRNKQQKQSPSSEPPVAVGEQLDVEIEDVGEQGDGVARVGPGYVVFVPDTQLGDRVTVEVTKTLENFGFAEVVTPEPVTG